MQKTKLIIERIICVVCLIVGTLITIINIRYINSYGNNYTKCYTTYNEVSSIQKLDELRYKLQELNIQYSIKGSTLTIKNNSLVSFEIKNDDTCYVNHNDFIKTFKKLDEEDRSVVEIHGILEKGKIKEKITFEDDSKYIFTKVDNQYYVKSITNPLTLIGVGVAVTILGLILLFIDIIHFFKKRKSIKSSTI